MPTETSKQHHEIEKSLQPGELHLIFCTHEVGNYSRILDAVEATSPDIIAVELAGESELMRHDFEQEVNAQISGRQPGEVADDIGYLEEDIIERFRGTSVRYVTIDAELETEAGELVKQAGQHLWQYGKYEKDTSPTGAVYRRFHAENYLETTSRGDAMREEIMADQLEALADANPGKRITAIIGMLHDRIADDIDDDISVEVTYVPRKADEERGLHGRFTRYELGQRALAAGTMRLDEVLAYCLDRDGRFIDYDD